MTGGWDLSEVIDRKDYRCQWVFPGKPTRWMDAKERSPSVPRCIQDAVVEEEANLDPADLAWRSTRSTVQLGKDPTCAASLKCSCLQTLP